MAVDLKCCPFCGGEATPDYSCIEGEAAYHFHCQNANCPAWPNVQGETEAEAIAAWNTRAPDLTERAAIVALCRRHGFDFIAGLIEKGKHHDRG